MIPLIGAQSNPGGGVLLPPYSPQGIAFNGSDRWLHRTSDLIGSTNSKLGTLFLRLKIDSAINSSNGYLLRAGTGRLQIYKDTSGNIQIVLKSISNTTVLLISSSTAYSSADGWISLMASWDLLNAGTGRLYVNDVSDYTETIYINGTIDYQNANWEIGSGSAGGSFLWNGCLADFYWNQGVYMDFDVTANRRKFTTAEDGPVDLGPTGANPTGSDPIAFFSGPVVDWQDNLGTGGAFIENGTLTACATNP